MKYEGNVPFLPLRVREQFSGIRKSEQGSISILILGFFFLLLTLAFVLTDLATMVVAQRSLTNATENAVMRSAQVLDRNAYYRGNSGVSVPSDCPESRLVAMRELDLWGREDGSIRRPEISHITLQEFICSGDTVEVTTSGQLTLPFALPGSTLERIVLKATVGAKSRRAN